MNKLQKEIDRLEKQVKELKAQQRFCVYYGHVGNVGAVVHRVETKTSNLGKLAEKSKGIRLKSYGRVHFLRFEDGNGEPLSGRHFIRGKIYKNSSINGPQAFGISLHRGYVRGYHFEEDDVNIDYKGNVLASGSGPKYVKWRNERNAKRAKIQMPKGC